MSKSRKDQRSHRRKVAGSTKGLSEHKKRAKRRKHKNKYRPGGSDYLPNLE